MTGRDGRKRSGDRGTDTPRGDPEVTERIRKEMSKLPTKRLVYIVKKIMQWWDQAEAGDKMKFTAVRGMIFEMNEWMGYTKERIFIENLESGDPRQVIKQYLARQLHRYVYIDT